MSEGQSRDVTTRRRGVRQEIESVSKRRPWTSMTSGLADPGGATVFQRCFMTPQPKLPAITKALEMPRALCRTRTDDPFLTMEVLYQLS
jgi:hypothetical protein